MKNPIRLLTFLFLMFSGIAASGQFYDIGQEPASTKWLQLHTGNFTVIYPAFLSTRAFETAAAFSRADSAVASGLNVRPAGLPLILHPQNPLSNAYTVWAPRRIEILTLPPQDMYGQPWLQQLALHEYRHVAQLTAINTGFSKVLGYLFGQQAAAAMIGIFVPPWFLEGDAVCSETALSETGRGRVPAFAMPLRAQLTGKGAFSYPKASLGSYRDFVPDIYIIGYHIVAASLIRYGEQLWSGALSEVARHPWTVTPFNAGLKKNAGLNKKGLYLQAVRMLDSLWLDTVKPENRRLWPEKRSACHTDYLHPHRVSDSLVVALKTSFATIPQLVSIDPSGNETILHSPGYINDNLVSYGGGYLAWSEYRPDLRWENAGTTDLMLFNPLRHKLIRIHYRGRISAPVVSPDGLNVAGVTFSKTGDCRIQVITPDSVVDYPLPRGVTALVPAWSPDGRFLVYIALSNQGKALVKLSLPGGEHEFLSPYTSADISNPVVTDEGIIYTGSYRQKSELFLINPVTHQTFVLTRSAYGADQASLYGNLLTFTDYTSDGFRIAEQSASLKRQMAGPVDESNTWPLADALSEHEHKVTFSTLPGLDSIQPLPYKKAAHLFNFHSWAPLYIDIGGESLRPGASVMSQNLLSTLFITGGYDYSIEEKTGMFRTAIEWKEWYPVLKASFSDGNRASSGIPEGGGQALRYTWRETGLDLSLSQTLTFSRGAYTRAVYGEASFNYADIRHNETTPLDFINGSISGFTYRTSIYAYRRQAYRELAPRWGYYLDLQFRHTPIGQNRVGNIAGIQTQWYLPGIAASHSFQFYMAYQQCNPEKYRFSNLISTSRGYTAVMNGDKLLSLKAAYKLPLMYPDIHLGGLLYVKRIRAGFFQDVTRSDNAGVSVYYNATGLDLVADFHLFGISVPMSAGIRAIYREYDRIFTSALLFTMNFYAY